MIVKRLFKLILHCTLLATVSLTCDVIGQSSASDTATELGWIPSDNLCRGYFQEPDIVLSNPNPGDITEETTHITAQGPVRLANDGVSILQKNVVVTQKGRMITADIAYIYRDGKTGKINRVVLSGHVHLREAGKLIVTRRATLILYPQKVILTQSAYYYHSEGGMLNSDGPFNAWGTAEHGVRHPNHIVEFKHATYSTCNPTDPAWKIHASTIKIDHQNDVGKAYNALITFKHIPIFYFPYYQFPVTNDRKSGFLTPTFGYDNQNGVDFVLPYYWNMEPNYDMLLYPEYMSFRGYRLSDYFRYMTQDSSGSFYASYLPDDRQFDTFRTQSISTYSNTSVYNADTYRPFISDLENEHNYRGFVSFNNTTAISDEWLSHIDLNYASDPYYFNDLSNNFASGLNSASSNQLLNQFDIDYSYLHWNFSGLVQAYQTLHEVNQINAVYDQYQRLPDLTTSAYYPGLIGNTGDLDFSSEFVNFSYASDFTPNQSMGQRVDLRPGFGMPYYFGTGYVKPEVWVDTTGYNVVHQQPGEISSEDRTLPIANIDTGYYFDNNFSFHNTDYVQTLEPRLFYLYVPYENQDDLPNFDTVLQPFSYQQLFSLNRFTGYDRIENANQLNFGLTSRILNGDDGSSVFTSDLGLGYYIEQPKVCLDGTCITTGDVITPIVGDVTFYPGNYWSTTFSYVWDPSISATNNATVSLNYSRDNTHIFGIGYNYVYSNTFTTVGNTDYDNSTRDIILSLSWPLIDKWSFVGYTEYNLSWHRPDEYYVGLQYDTCCWTFRIMNKRSFDGYTVDNGGNIQNEFNDAIYFQLSLKGLGDFGNRNVSDVLSTTLPGYST